PDAEMAAAASALAEFATANGDLLLDLIYGHLRYAEENGWLSFSGVKPGLGRNRVLKRVKSITLAVRRDRNGRPDASVFGEFAVKTRIFLPSGLKWSSGT